MSEIRRASYREVLDKLDSEEVVDDTKASKFIFDNYEEGYEDEKIKSEPDRRKRRKRRDWLIIADIYNNGQHTQKFHLRNYIEFKLQDGFKESDPLYDGRIRNAALYLYIREVIYGDNVDSACQKVEASYKKNKRNDGYQVNKVPGLHHLIIKD